MEKGTRISVLDKGYVELVDYMGDDSYAIRAARMSTGKGFQGWEKDAGLLRYLYSHKHLTPFEMSELIVEVKAPIFVFREWHRHRTQSYNEFSARYSVMPDEHYIPRPSRIRGQNDVNKQMSGLSLPEYTAQKAVDVLVDGQERAYDHYHWLLEQGVAKEVARLNTPVSRYSKMWAKSNLRNWLQFLQLRMAENAQEEIRAYANAVAQVIQAIWPRTYELFVEHTLNGRSLSAGEIAVLRGIVMGDLSAEDLPTVMGEKESTDLLAKLGLA